MFDFFFGVSLAYPQWDRKKKRQNHSKNTNANAIAIDVRFGFSIRSIVFGYSLLYNSMTWSNRWNLSNCGRNVCTNKWYWLGFESQCFWFDFLIQSVFCFQESIVLLFEIINIIIWNQCWCWITKRIGNDQWALPNEQRSLADGVVFFRMCVLLHCSNHKIYSFELDFSFVFRNIQSSMKIKLNDEWLSK